MAGARGLTTAGRRVSMAFGRHHLPAAAAGERRHGAVHHRAHVVRARAGSRRNRGGPDGRTGGGRLMDAFTLIGSLLLLIAMGVPVAYALGLAALVGAWWVDIPFEGVMIKISEGVNRFTLLAIPFFVLAGAIMAEVGMSRRLVNLSFVFVGWVLGR